jgi:hypothetical protein
MGVDARLTAPEVPAAASLPFPIVALGLLLLVSSVQTSCGGQTADQCPTNGYGDYGYYDAYCP